jgi:hypothetical protein
MGCTESKALPKPEPFNPDSVNIEEDLVASIHGETYPAIVTSPVTTTNDVTLDNGVDTTSVGVIGVQQNTEKPVEINTEDVDKYLQKEAHNKAPPRGHFVVSN